MSALHHRLTPLVLLLASAALPAFAASSTASASSDSASTSVGSVSGSFEKSSASSTGDRKSAAGDYKVVEVAAAPGRPGMARLKLLAVADGASEGEFFLYLPQKAADDGRIAVGQFVTANPREYGVEFVRHDDRQPFFLVLADEWFRELQTRVVTL